MAAAAGVAVATTPVTAPVATMPATTATDVVPAIALRNFLNMVSPPVDVRMHTERS